MSERIPYSHFARYTTALCGVALAGISLAGCNAEDGEQITICRINVDAEVNQSSIFNYRDGVYNAYNYWRTDELLLVHDKDEVRVPVEQLRKGAVTSQVGSIAVTAMIEDGRLISVCP